jgi:hypothetical protein
MSAAPTTLDFRALQVDADAHRELGEKFGVQGFPTIKWFPAGEAAKPEDYSGGRTAGACEGAAAAAATLWTG